MGLCNEARTQSLCLDSDTAALTNRAGLHIIRILGASASALGAQDLFLMRDNQLATNIEILECHIKLNSKVWPSLLFYSIH